MDARDYQAAMEKVRLSEAAKQRILAAAEAPAPKRRVPFPKQALAVAALLALVAAPVALRGLRGGFSAKNSMDAGAVQSSAAAVPQTAAATQPDEAPAAAGGAAENEAAPRLAMAAPQEEAAEEDGAMSPYLKVERLAQLLGLELDSWTEERDQAKGPQGTDTARYSAGAGAVVFTVADEGVYAAGGGLPEPPADAGVEVLSRNAAGAPTQVFLPD